MAPMTLPADLSKRERQVLAMRVDYFGQREIAEKLRISAKTVQIYLGRARLKFQARSMGEMLRRARLAGITPQAVG
jgi:two-component system, LuxR family, response regulator FixJ